MKFEAGQVAVVTGGASGIGYALASALGTHGNKLVIADIRRDSLDDAQRTLTEAGHEVLAVQTDVSDAESVQKLADATIAHYGRVDSVFNNAGIVGPTAPMWEQNLDSWDRLINVKLKGVVHGVKAFAPILVEQGYGHIVNTASGGGLIILPGMTPYNATMHAVVGLTETLNNELKGVSDDLGATVLCPGLVATPLYQNSESIDPDAALMTSASAQGMSAAMNDESGKAVTPQHVAESTLAAVEAGRVHAITGTGRSRDIFDRASSVMLDLLQGD